MTKPMNLLFIFSDQHNRPSSGCYGNPIVKTPNLDRLAENGTVFRNAYCNGPICVPSRGSMATGMSVNKLETWDNCSPYFGQMPSWGHRMIADGKRAISIGKLHYRETSDSNGFDEEIIPMHIIQGVGMLFTICRNPMPTQKKFSWLVENSGAGNSTYLQYDNDITNKAIEWLEKEATKNSDQPWTLFVSLVCPHPPWVAPERFFNLYPAEEIPLPIAYSETERSMHQGLEDFRRFFGVQGTFENDVLKKVTSAYYGMISYLDENIGKLLGTLEKTGLSGNTRVIYSSDHGESMGQKGMFSKCNMYEESVGIPMIISGPDLPQGQEVNTPTQLMDIFPTILEATGVTAKDEDQELEGRSLLSLAQGETPGRSILSEQHSAGAKSAVYMIRKGKWKYVHYVEGYPSQLFNLEEDPNELSDLGTNPDCSNQLVVMEQELRTHLDPEKVDQKAKDKQAERLELGGGMEAVLAKGSPGYTPAPGEEPEYM